ncbi:MAG TPA: hypothetical protein VKW09_01045 [bacterium]|nr:hypothetical protein [bacterium]
MWWTIVLLRPGVMDSRAASTAFQNGLPMLSRPGGAVRRYVSST